MSEFVFDLDVAREALARAKAERDRAYTANVVAEREVAQYTRAVGVALLASYGLSIGDSITIGPLPERYKDEPRPEYDKRIHALKLSGGYGYGSEREGRFLILDHFFDTEEGMKVRLQRIKKNGDLFQPRGHDAFAYALIDRLAARLLKQVVDDIVG